VRPFAAALAIVVFACLGACRQEPAPPAAPTAGPRVENAALGLALAEVPAPFEVDDAAGEAITLTIPGSTPPPRLWIEAGPVEDHGINLHEEIGERRAEFEALPGGQYHGNRELGTPIGPAFSARGSWRAEGGGRVEETWIYVLHPDVNRLVTLRFQYDPAQSAERVHQLLAVLGEVEGLGGAGEPSTPEP
jgi:hypothetical protein